MTTQRVERTDNHAGGPTGYFLTDAATPTEEKISARASLLATATQVLGEKIEDLQSLSDRGVVERVVGHAFPKVDLEGKDPAYAQALFDLAAKGVTYTRDSATTAAGGERARMVRTLEAAGLKCDGKPDAYVEAAYATLTKPTTPRRSTPGTAAPSTAEHLDAANRETAESVRRDAHVNHIARRNGAAERTDSDLRRWDAFEFAEHTGEHLSLMTALERGSLPPVLASRADALVRDLVRLGMEPPAALRSRFDALMEERADKADPQRVRATAHQRHVGGRSAPAPVRAQRADLGSDADDAATPQRDPRADAHQQFMNTRNGGK